MVEITLQSAAARDGFHLALSQFDTGRYMITVGTHAVMREDDDGARTVAPAVNTSLHLDRHQILALLDCAAEFKASMLAQLDDCPDGCGCPLCELAF